MALAGRVSPFGNPRIKACSRLPAAYRSVPRPSSPLDAKASTKRPSLLEIRTPKQPAGRTLQAGKGAPRRRQPCAAALAGSAASPSQSGNTSCANPRTTCPNQCLLTMSETALPGFCRTGEPLEAGQGLPPETWWSRTGSNRRPPACKAGALPTELRPLPGHLRALAGADARPCGRRAPDKWWAWIDLNYRPHPYQGCALTD